MRILKLGLILPLLVACQREAAPVDNGGQLNLEAAGQEVAVTYACGQGQSLSVIYDEAGEARVSVEGRERRLVSQPAQRGAVYGDGQVRWHLVNDDNRENGTLTGPDGKVLQCSRQANTAAPAPALTACRADQLDVAAGEMDAGMGHRHLPVSISVKGAVGCILPRWPELSLMPLDVGKSIKVERTTDSYFAKADGADRIALEPGQTAQFFIGWGVIPHEGDGEMRCPELEGWRVKAPGGGELAQIATQIQACGSRLTISPFSNHAEQQNAAPKTS